ncbi:MAG: hypothetical protein OEW35_12215 [Gammaproteobacteria bacterium]|nr:hypothetical protein [Gammaproteobacteria bacterium]MDH5310695.1 hypothetical protein [Gammaproteobacteria bacterium]
MNNSRRRPSALTTAASMLLGLVLAATAHAGSFTLNVVDQDGNPVEGFRWLVQQDATFDHQPGESIPNAAEPDNYPFSLSFHRSYHPLARTEIGGTGLSGNTDLDTVTIDDVADGRYYVSVLPYADHSISGQPVRVEAGAGGDVTVVVQRQPIPTAQIAIYLFLDNAPVNGVPDLPEETNPAAGEPGHVDWSEFSLFLEEPAGRYGMAGGQVIQDAFGNPLGTTYLKGCDENGQADADPTSNYGCFDADGAPIVVTPGDGTLHPNPNGTMLVENLAPGKYGVIMIPPTGQNWQQTSTIEGTKVIDAWVKANEPPFFVEFGLPGPHVFIGYIKSSANGGFPPMQPPAFGQDTATISGTVTDMHMSRPPAFEFFSGRPFPGCWVALNDMTVGVGRGVWAGPCDADSNFEIPDVPPGNYQLKVFDDNLDVVIATLPVSVDANNGTCNNDPDAASCALGEVPVFNWFARLSTGVFSDLDQDGFWDDGEPGIGPESQDVSLRWRDGTMYQNFPTDGEGMAPFDEMFPFFHWLVAEVSFANKKATGATFVVDAGGPVDKSTDAFPSYGELNPQHQCVDDGSGATVGHQPDGTCPPGAEAINPHTLDDLSRTEVGQVLTQGVQGFLGQTNVMHFGKAEYLSFTPFVPPTPTTPPIPGAWVGENGGISGIVYYAVTRAEDEPQFAAAEEWEPGIPNVQLAMYADGDIDSFPLGDWPSGPGDIDWDGDGVLDGDDGMIDDANLNGIPGELADVDNFPFGNFPGPEDVDRDDNGGTPGVFDLGDALQVAVTDSWDASLPTGCQGEDYVYQQKELIGGEIVVTSEHPTDCYDGLRNFNQIRPAVFDGGFAFADYDLDNINPNVAADIQAYYDYVAGLQASGRISQASYDALQLGLLPGQYIIEAAAPPGYEHIKEEDRNVDFGDNYIPSAQALAVPCVGDDHLVPPYFSMSTRDGSGGELQLIPGIDPAEAAAPYANIMRPLCDRKEVQLSSAQNAGVEFFLMTDVPIVANVAGMILNDMASEFDPNAPTFGEKAAPPWVPVGFYDFDGKQVNRVYADQYGRYNAVLPSTYTTNLPQPSGMSPNMLIACMNDAGPIEEIDPATGEPTGKLIIDPYFDQRFSQFCYTFQYMPGVITYLDTPVLPIAAFAGPGNAPLDCERPAATPVIASVTRSTLDGPYVNGTVQSTILIDSMGMQEVPNPEWNGISFGDRVIWRDYGFGGADGTVQLRNRDNNVVANLAHTWGNDQISATVPAGTPAGQYQVVVTSADGTESPIGATLTVGPGRYAVRRVSEGQSIQAAIDLAAPGDLILVGPGVYDELVIMWKPVALQGWGAGVVSINARQAPTEKVANWRNKASTLVAQGAISQLTGQQVGVPAFPALDEVVFPTEEGAGIFVAGRRPQGAGCGNPNNSAFRCMLARHDARPRIDGITIVGASTGGGIVVNGYNEDLEIGNMRLNANAGFYGGGIRIGHPTVSHVVTQGNDPDGQVGDIVYDDANNDNVRIHHNHVAQNGGFGGAGGGVSLHTGTDNYRVENNWICGNYSQGDGGGIGHLGRSRGGRIVGNDIIFNESFDQMLSTSGGGIFVGGQAPLMPASNTGRLVTPGSGNVDIDANNIRGNLAGGGQGGGVRIASVNGAELDTNTSGASAVANWYRVRLFNNMITNNVAGLAGGGVSLQDAVRTVIRNNTIANNDSTATAGLAFPAGNPNASVAQPAGVASNVHSAEFALLMANDVNPNVYAGPRDAATWPVYTDPVIRDSVVLHNRSFYWVNDPAQCPAPGYCLLPDPATPAYADFAIMNGILPADTGLAGDLATLQPLYSLLTDAAAFPAGWNNISGAAGNSDFANGYFNAGRGQTIVFAEGTTLQTAGAFDEGGNWLQVGFSPLSLLEPGANADPALNTTQFDYHLAPGSAAIGAATPSGHTGLLSVDIDREPRVDPGSDIGADEAQ